MRIEAIGITTGYARSNAIEDISLHLAVGEIVGLIGPNGSGKTTLLRALSRVLPLRSGELLYDGEVAKRLSYVELARRIAFVPQSESRLFEFSVRDVVLMGRHPHLKGVSHETTEDYAAARRAMEATDTLHLADRFVTDLSGGEHRRVLIARALAQEAPVLFLDEPVAHLDITHQAELMALCRSSVIAENASIMAAMHDLNLASEYCDRLILLDGGRVVATGTPDEVLTEDSLCPVYGAALQVLRNPATGRPIVIPGIAGLVSK